MKTEKQISEDILHMKRRNACRISSAGDFMDKRILKRLVAFASAAVMTVSAAGCGKSQENKTEEPSARVTVDGTKFMVNGKELWINGVNTPWQKWNDFGGDMDRQFWDDTFAQLAEDGINCTRIWINCSGENIVRLKTTGGIKEIKAVHWENLDKLLK